MSYDGVTMSTQLSITQEDKGWAILNGSTAIAIGGVVHRDTKEDLVKEITSKGLFVWTDNTIQKTPEEGLSVKGKLARVKKLDAEDAMNTAVTVESYTPEPAPATEDPPTDPDSRPGDDPNPTVPVVEPKPKRQRASRAKVVKPKDDGPSMVFADDDVSTHEGEPGGLAEPDFDPDAPNVPEESIVPAEEDIQPAPVVGPEAEPAPDDYSDLLDEAVYDAALTKPVETPPEIAEFQETVEKEVKAAPKRSKKVDAKITADYDKLSKTVAEAKKAARATVDKTKAERKPRAKKPADAPRFTEEQKKARAEYAKKYRQSMTDEQKEQAKARAAERQKRWRENHPDAVQKYAKRSSERRKERYNEDPAYRADYRSKQRAYASAGKSES